MCGSDVVSSSQFIQEFVTVGAVKREVVATCSTCGAKPARVEEACMSKDVLSLVTRKLLPPLPGDGNGRSDTEARDDEGLNLMI